jgi:hypothetical protein
VSTYRGDLLQPSLGHEGQAPRAAPYSTTTGFVSSFIGGPFAALIISALNVHRCGRWRADAPWLAVVVLLALAWSAWLPSTAFYASWHASVVGALGRSGWRYAGQVVALALYGLMYWRHRREDRAADLFSLKRPNGWLAGLLAILAGGGLSTLMHFFFAADQS